MVNDNLYRPSTALKDNLKYLYKYRSLDDHTERIITHNEVYFSPISSFNDPFDCKCSIITEYGSYNDKFKYLYEVHQKYHQGIDDLDGRMKIAIALNTDLFNQTVIDVYNRIIGKMGVLCLSATNNNILLWSHYAENHKGLCIQFKVKKDNDFIGKAEKVKYQSNYPTTDFFKWVELNFGGLEVMPLIKSQLWEYEKEYRIIKHHDSSEDIESIESLPPAHGIATFPEELLSGIIFGCKMEKSDKNKVRGWIKQRKTKPRLYQAQMKKKEFGLDIIPI